MDLTTHACRQPQTACVCVCVVSTHTAYHQGNKYHHSLVQVFKFTAGILWKVIGYREGERGLLFLGTRTTLTSSVLFSVPTAHTSTLP